MGSIMDSNFTLSWSDQDAVKTYREIVDNVESRTDVINAVLGFIGRNFQGGVFSVKVLREALQISNGGMQVGVRGDKFGNLLYDIARKPATSKYLTNIGKHDGQTNYALTDEGFAIYGEVQVPSDAGERYIDLGSRYPRALHYVEADDTPTNNGMLTLPLAVDIIKKLNGKVKSLENTVTTLYQRNEELQREVVEASAKAQDYIEIDAEIQEILNTL
jgi:hypothetical protein